MPEGHTTHRIARAHRALFAGRRVAVSSPQGRFAAGARVLDGMLLHDVQAHGKHLLYRWEQDTLLHVHLGLVGTFVTHEGAPPEPSPAVRLRLATSDAAADLTGPLACELVSPPQAERIVAQLGPDPLRRGAEPERVRAALAARRAPIGAALLDQRVLAGIGNVFRAESLFVCGIDPARPAREVADDGFDALWSTLRGMLRQGLRDGRIVTVDPAEVGARSRARVPDEERTYVYRREGRPCRRCGTPVRSWTLGSRRVYACPTCQR